MICCSNRDYFLFFHFDFYVGANTYPLFKQVRYRTSDFLVMKHVQGLRIHERTGEVFHHGRSKFAPTSGLPLLYVQQPHEVSSLAGLFTFVVCPLSVHVYGLFFLIFEFVVDFNLMKVGNW